MILGDLIRNGEMGLTCSTDKKHDIVSTQKKIWLGDVTGWNHLGDVSVDWRIILKRILQKQMLGCAVALTDQHSQISGLEYGDTVMNFLNSW